MFTQFREGEIPNRRSGPAEACGASGGYLLGRNPLSIGRDSRLRRIPVAGPLEGSGDVTGRDEFEQNA